MLEGDELHGGGSGSRAGKLGVPGQVGEGQCFKSRCQNGLHEEATGTKISKR